MNKITQLINKIFHRTEKAVADISMFKENNVDSPSKKNKPKITLLQKRFLWCLIGIVLLTGVYFWWRIPARMRVVAVIPKNYDNEYTSWNPLGLLQLKGSAKSALNFITQYGWDGKPVWSLNVPVAMGNIKIEQLRYTTSSDGHVIAILIIEKNNIRVLSWRDGNLLGDAYIDMEDWNDSEEFSVANSGRVWLYNYKKSYCDIKAIDNTHVAEGRLNIQWLNNDPTFHFWRLSPDENLMAVQQGDDIIQYWILTVKKNKVLIKKSITHKNASFYFYGFGYSELSKLGLEVDNNGILHDLSGEIVINPKPGWCSGKIVGNNQMIYFQSYKHFKTNFLFVDLLSKKQWNIKSSQPDARVLCGTPDGKRVLICEFNKDIPYYLQKLFRNRFSFTQPISDYLNRHFYYEQLTLYNNSGIPIAILPINFYYNEYDKCKIINQPDLYNFAISSDGRKIGTEFYSNKKKAYYYVIFSR